MRPVIKAPTSGDGKKPGGHRLGQAEGHQSESEKEQGCFQQSDVITMSYHTVPGKTKQTSETNHEQQTQRSFREKKKSKIIKQNKITVQGTLSFIIFNFGITTHWHCPINRKLSKTSDSYLMGQGKEAGHSTRAVTTLNTHAVNSATIV